MAYHIFPAEISTVMGSWCYFHSSFYSVLPLRKFLYLRFGSVLCSADPMIMNCSDTIYSWAWHHHISRPITFDTAHQTGVIVLISHVDYIHIMQRPFNTPDSCNHRIGPASDSRGLFDI